MLFPILRKPVSSVAVTAAALVFAWLLASPPLHASPVSEFTSTAPEDSKLISEENDASTHLCKGLAGYDVLFEQSHGRSWINLVFDSETFDLMNATLQASPGTFPHKADDVVLWRGNILDGQFSPFAVIYRMRSLSESDPNAFLETFVIIQAAQGATRVIGSLPATEGIAAAEALADRLCGE